MLLIYGAVAAPVPAVNEPHYLGKAKHFWNPDWCAGDLLFESSNAHAVFYWTMGFWAYWLTLPQLAWLGRIIGYGLMACGWQRTHAVFGLIGWPTWWSLLGFLTLASWGNFSGEWIVGGIEGKVFAYAFLLLAFADWQSNRPYWTALWAGLAVSFHPIAGGWAVLAAMLTCVVGLRTCKHSWWALTMSGILFMIAALPGFIPVLGLLTASDSPKVQFDGTYLQVYYRLAHHLDPMTFSWRSWAGYGVLLALALMLHRTMTQTIPGRFWWKIVFWSGVFALIGLLAGWGTRPVKFEPKSDVLSLQILRWFQLLRMNVLKFYPFRLFDVLVPLTVAIEATSFLFTGRVPKPGFSSGKPGFIPIQEESPADQRPSRALLAATLLLAAIAGGLWWQHQFLKPTAYDKPEWIEACHWIEDHTPASALVQTPVRNQNFKWHAERAEYVAYKDVPQDNASLVEWNRRMRFLHKWYQDQHADGIYSNDELRQLRSETGITHILADKLGPFELPPCYTNRLFRVYDLSQLDDSP